MASVIPRQVKKEVVDGWLAETAWKVCLLTSGFTYNSATHVTYSDLTNEVVGTGYTAGGATLTMNSWGSGATGYESTVNATIDAADVSWTGASFTARYAVVYETVGGKIRAIYQYTVDKSVTDGTFTIVWNSLGMIRIK